MALPLLQSKLFVPPFRPSLVPRPRLLDKLSQGLHGKLTLLSAPAGFGKTTLVSEWIAGIGRGVAWLSLDEGDNDPARFLTYLVAALQTIAPTVGDGPLALLHSPQPPPAESILTDLLNEIASVSDPFVLVLDDYHLIDAKPVDDALTFLLEHLPPHLHLVIATREDPQLPLARLRARGQLTELRAADLRFTASEAAEFLNQVMNLQLAAEEISALEERTEGWIVGLQLAALSLQGRPDTASFIQTFTGSHHFVLDYLVEEVLQRQPECVQEFLLRTSILNRLCGPLCDAVLLDPSVSGQETLKYLQRANLFLVPLDDERRWFRYHHLFAELLRQRLPQSAVSSTGAAGSIVADLHGRASQWYEENNWKIEAFQHATAAHDVTRAVRLIEGEGVPLHLRVGGAPVRKWLESLPTAILDANPVLWVTYASALLMSGQVIGVEQKVQAAESALQDAELDDKTRDLIGRIASIRATLAVTQHQVETIITQSRRALAYLHPNNLPVRTSVTWALGYAYHLQGERAAARQTYSEAISIGQAIGHMVITMMATIGLGRMQEADTDLHLAAESYWRAVQLAGDPPPPPVCDAYLGLARLSYEWNDLGAAQEHGQRSAELARRIANTDRLVLCELFLARLKLAQGEVAAAASIWEKANQSARQHNFVQQMPEVVAVQVMTLIQQNNLTAAAQLALTHDLPLSLARVHLAQGDPSSALAALEPLRRQVEVKRWADERLKVMILQAVAHHLHGEKVKAVQLLSETLVLAERGGFIRLFIDEGAPMAQLLSEAAAHGIMPHYVGKLLAVLDAKEQKRGQKPNLSPAQFLVEPLSERELEVLQLIAQGLSNREIGERLFLALNTVKGHNRIIFGKLQVQRRTEAVASARELGLL